MNKHGVLLGSLGTLALVVVLGASFTWASAQEIKLFVPFLNGQTAQQDVSSADASDAADVADKSAEPASILPFDNPRPGEIRPVPVEALPTAAPITAEEEAEMRKALEEMGPEETEIIIVAGPETKGQHTQILSVGWVDLPSDVWVDFHGQVNCRIESYANGDCITGLFTVLKRDNSPEKLFLKDGLPLYTSEQDESKVIQAFTDVIVLIEQAKYEGDQ